MTIPHKCTETSPDLKLVITRTINAPCDLVFKAWTDPQVMAQWFGPREVECRSVTADIRVGGAFRIHMASEKGDHIAIGTYQRIVPNELLQLTWEWEHYTMPNSVVTVEFQDLGKTTRLTLTHANLPDAEDVADHNRGWTSMLDKFAGWMELRVLPEGNSAGKNSSTEDCVGREFVITRELDAPRELVFRACTEPKHLAQWWGPKGFTAPVCEWDGRPGGKIFVIMRGPDGTEYPMGGEVREVVAPELMVSMTGALDAEGNYLFQILHTLTLLERNGKTRLMMHSCVIQATPGAGRYIGGFEMGMTMSLERLGEHLAQLTESSMGMETTDCEIVITRVVEGPRELVWEAMTDPKQVIHWWGPRGFTTTIEEMDVRPGGEWKHVMHGPDGANYPNHCIFKEVVRPERLVFSNGGRHEGGPDVQFVATWTFDIVEPGRTKVTIRMVFPSAPARDLVVREFGAIEGAKQTLARLDEHLAIVAISKTPILGRRTTARTN